MEQQQQKEIGRVKKFIPKKGYGFIITENKENEELFVYRSDLCVKNPEICRFPKLFPGEFVEFNVINETRKEGKLKRAISVSGLGNSTLSCEFVAEMRNEERKKRPPPTQPPPPTPPPPPTQPPPPTPPTEDINA